MRVYRGLLLLGIVLRLLFALIPGNSVWPPWSAGGDVLVYATLAENLLHGRGYTYSGEPTALRPPLYPLLLAGCMATAARFWPIVLRVVQFLLGLGTAFLGAKAAGKLWGKAPGRVAGLLILYCPTLVYPTSTTSPEALAAFLVGLVFYCAVENLGKDSRAELGGVAIGLAALTRQVAPVLGVPFVILYLRRHSFRALMMLLLASALVVSPWALRNYQALGTPRLSTLGGYDLVNALVDPQGRAQTGAEIRPLLGWALIDYERNNRAGSYPPERQMDLAAGRMWFRLVRRHPLWPFELLPAKLSWFWLSTDILFYSGGYARGVQLGRAAMVFVWWGYLLLAVLALGGLWRRGRRGLFWLFVGWLALVTAAHIPFAMNTRYRIPLADLAVAMLASYWLARTRLACSLFSLDPDPC